ncbi:BnaC08g20080D [Brassica napus]|uniref:(rape) hypothetical protein n=2 Tax=Brassica napus TaxID=3708 RepID=A0A078HN80_BRANA|nr:unnamed protein product [Brassica napus]CDY38834.1 BnaC08g20080D [Brassica napus]
MVLESVLPTHITKIMTASKYVEDLNYRNSYFAKVGELKIDYLRCFCS